MFKTRWAIGVCLGLAVLSLSRNVQANYVAATTYRFVDLTPSGYSGANATSFQNGLILGQAYDFSTGQQVWQAGYWTGGASTFKNLLPVATFNNYHQSQTYGYDGTSFVGTAYTNSQAIGHALMWASGSTTPIDLTPASPGQAAALGIYNGITVGYTYTSFSAADEKACIWTGQNASTVHYINPSGYSSTFAVGIYGNSVIEQAIPNGTSNYDAVVWNLSNGTFSDITPAGDSKAYPSAINGSQIVGGAFATGSNQEQAVLWQNGTTTSLTPAGAASAVAVGTNGFQQVGSADPDPNGQQSYACVWTGTAGSCIDLQQFAPAAYDVFQVAGIDSSGDVFGQASYNGQFHAVEFVPVPEPAISGSILFLAMVLGNRKTKTRNRV